jgi:hypothetical protein
LLILWLVNKHGFDLAAVMHLHKTGEPAQS